jgi:hypothetical protein
MYIPDYRINLSASLFMSLALSRLGVAHHSGLVPVFFSILQDDWMIGYDSEITATNLWTIPHSSGSLGLSGFNNITH